MNAKPRFTFAAIVLLVGLQTAGPACGDDDILDLRQQARQLGAELRHLDAALRVHADRLAASGHDTLAAASADVEAAEQRVDAIIEADAELTEARRVLQEAQAARDAKVDALLSDAPSWQAFLAKRKAVHERVSTLESRLAKLTDEEVLALAAARLEADALDRTLYHARRAMWNRGEVQPLYREADKAYKAWNSMAGKHDALKAAQAAQREAVKARQALPDQVAATGDDAAALIRQRQANADALAAIDQRIDRLLDERVGRTQWTTQVKVDMPPHKGKPRDPTDVYLWIPPKVKQVRGIVMGHPPAIASSLPKDRIIRCVAAEAGLAVLYFQNMDALFNYSTDTPKRFEKVLADLAAKSSHEEIARVPWLTIGHSTSGIFARNVAYWQPQRTIGVVHIKSGNLHQHRPDPTKTLAGVPFIAINGEFEEYGPEGGIQPAYGAQTQWVMIREQMLRLRRADANHLMSLVVHPGGGHGDWNAELTDLVALFIRQAAAARLPKELPAEGIVLCRSIDPAAGWLSDAKLDHPASPPAPAEKYTGDRSDTFWHLDETMARAVEQYHRDRFVLPDPTAATPIPETWPPRRE